MSTTTPLKAWFPRTTTPFLALAPMYPYADAELATAVTSAGGLGFIACGFDFSEESPQRAAFEAQLAKARSLLSITDEEAPLPVGLGFITLRVAGFIENVLPVLVKHRVSAIWLAFPPSGTHHRDIITRVRAAREETAWAVRIFVQVGTLASAREAIEQGADVIVAQGGDAGGHQWTQGVSVMVLVPEVRDLVNQMGKGEQVAVLAAGGIVDGRGVAAALSLGADGAVMGTRFICTTESHAPASMKQTILATTDGAQSTIKSTLHDTVQSSTLWPPTYDARAIIGPAYRDYLAGVPLEENVTKYQKAMAGGDKEGRKIIFAGAGIGIIKEVLSAKDVVLKTQKEAIGVIRRLGSILAHA